MSSYSEGQTHQLMDALERAGYTPADITCLGQFDNLSGIRDVLRGRANIVVVKHIVDLDAAPFLPNGWTVEKHIKGGQFEWDPARIALCPDWQLQSFNACLLDYLLAHPDLIPKECKGKRVYFWGTIYHDSYGSLYVRYLRWHGRQWRWRYSIWIGREHKPHPLKAAYPVRFR